MSLGVVFELPVNFLCFELLDKDRISHLWIQFLSFAAMLFLMIHSSEIISQNILTYWLFLVLTLEKEKSFI